MSLPPIPSTTSTHELLQHAAWVRRVARALVRGADRADDLEQETWLAALSHPPRGVIDPRNWLSGVARNVARHWFRREEARLHHEGSCERAASQRDASPAAGAIVARAEIQQRVAAGVLALAEPYRSTLLARYFDEQPPTEIARSLDVSVETVKTRLKRGLAQLREALDAQRGDAPTFEAALAPLFIPANGSLAISAAKAAAVVATIAAGIWIAVVALHPSSETTAGAPHRLAPIVAAMATPVRDPSPPPAQATAMVAVREPVQAPAEAPAPAAADATGSPVHLVGRLLLPDGNGAANVALHVVGWESSEERVLRFGLPKDWKDIDTVSGADGRFDIGFDAPPAYQFVLYTKLSGYAAATWRWGEIDAGTTKQLGDVPLRLAGRIRGRILDRNGAPLKQKGWSVDADGSHCTTGDGADETDVNVEVDAATGEFLLEDVPPGPVKLKAYSRITNWVEGPRVEVHSGEELHADITYAGPDTSHRITVQLFCRPFYIFEGDAAEILLSGPGIETKRARKIEHSSQSFAFDDVPPGRYSVEIRDPKFLPWQRGDLEPGSTLSAHLAGNASVKLHVVDAATGKPIDHYSLRIKFDTGRFPDTFEVLGEGDSPPAAGVFEGWIPAKQTLLVKAKGYAECAIEERPLAANQLTEVTARLFAGATLTGVVLRSDHKTPAANAHLHLAPRRSEQAGNFRVHHGSRDDDGGRDADADAHGLFSFTAVAAGHYTLTTGDDPPLQASLEDVAVAEETNLVSGLELVLPPSGRLVGRLIGPDGAKFTGLRIVVAGEDEDDRTRFERQFRSIGRKGGADAVHADGSFSVGPLPIGASTVLLQLPDLALPEGENTTMNEPGPSFSLGKATLRDGEETRVEFDVRASLPGRLRLSITVNDRPAAGAIAELVRDSRPEGATPPMNGRDLVACARIGADGTVVIDPVPVGFVHLVVRAIDRSWAHWPPTPIEVLPAAEASASLTVTLFDGEVVVKDRATGKALASTQLSIGNGDGAAVDYAVGATSDVKGLVHLRLAPGHYQICTTDLTPDAGSPFEWTEHGAAVESVAVDAGK